MRAAGRDAETACMRNLPFLPRVAAVLLMVVIAGVSATAANASQRLTTYKLPADFALPNDMVVGPDGATWVTDSSLGRIWRISQSGRIRHYELGQQPGGITVASGSMWVADAGGDAIHRVETDGSSQRYALDADSFPISITAGPDGALWFTEGGDDEIGRITVDGEITEYPLPTADAFAGDIAAGPDGALYFSEATAGKVGRITTAGAITEYDVPGDDPLPGAIVPGPDGALYLAERNDNVISRMTTAGEFTDEHALPRENADPVAMAKGVDGALYISEFMSGVVSRMTFDGTFSKAHRIPGGFNDNIVSAPDGALWVAQGSTGKVSRLDLGLDYPVTAEGTTFEAREDRSVTATVATFTDADPDARASHYDALISWGDGDRSYGTVQRKADGSFAVRGKHTYRHRGVRKVTVRITDGVGKDLDAKVVSWAVVSR
jgi:virginiamycin B lyase